MGAFLSSSSFLGRASDYRLDKSECVPSSNINKIDCKLLFDRNNDWYLD
jgi:hypothetical protein